MNHLALFNGIGGFQLAADWCGWNNIAHVEIDDFCNKVVARHFPNSVCHTDIKDFDGKQYAGSVDIISGGFPCQDISLAGKGAGLQGERSGLWYEYRRVVTETNPSWCVIENVPALRTRGLDEVLRSLHEIGYDAEWHCIPASYVGAPHRRDRIWIVAYTESKRVQGQRPGGEQELEAYVGQEVSLCYSKRPGYAQWETEPRVGRVVDGIPNRIHRIKALGNSIVPQVAYEIFKAIDCINNSTVQ